MNTHDKMLLAAMKQNGMPTTTMELAMLVRDKLAGVIEPEEAHEMGSDGESADLEVTYQGRRYLINVAQIEALDTGA